MQVSLNSLQAPPASGKGGERRRGSGHSGLTSIEFLAIGLEGAAVMNVDRVAFLRFPLALDGERDIDLQIVRSQSANSSRGEQ
jgi:hypothetical protein